MLQPNTITMNKLRITLPGEREAVKEEIENLREFENRHILKSSIRFDDKLPRIAVYNETEKNEKEDKVIKDSIAWLNSKTVNSKNIYFQFFGSNLTLTSSITMIHVNH
jgi:hypothetical protein